MPSEAAVSSVSISVPQETPSDVSTKRKAWARSVRAVSRSSSEHASLHPQRDRRVDARRAPRRRDARDDADERSSRRARRRRAVPTGSGSGTRSGASMRPIARQPSTPSATPASPPTAVTASVSTKSCATTSRGRAPTASRTPISCRRSCTASSIIESTPMPPTPSVAIASVSRKPLFWSSGKLVQHLEAAPAHHRLVVVARDADAIGEDRAHLALGFGDRRADRASGR